MTILPLCLTVCFSFSSLPNPNKEEVGLRSVEGGFAAVLKFSGKPTDDIVREKEKLLRSSLISNGLKPKDGCLLARYNDPGRTKSFMMVSSFFDTLNKNCSVQLFFQQPCTDICLLLHIGKICILFLYLCFITVTTI